MTVLLEDLPQSQRERMAYIELRVFLSASCGGPIWRRGFRSNRQRPRVI